MALHHKLPIYKVIFDLTRIVIAFVRHMPRDVKGALGSRILDECFQLSTLVLRANVAQDKVPHLVELNERNQLLEILFQLALDIKAMSKPQYAAVIALTDQIGQQAGGWKKKATTGPKQGSLDLG